MSTSAQKLVRSSPLPPLALIEHILPEGARPWYDEEFDLAQGRSHSDMTRQLGDFLGRVAELGGYGILADNPIWYWDQGKQKVFYADFALVATGDSYLLDRVTADHLLLACEVVTTTHSAKYRKDTETQKARNELHGVPEFLLLYPDLDDTRVLEWFVLQNGAYQLMQPREGRYASRSVPGLVIEPLAEKAWTRGRKFRVFYEDRAFRPALEEQHTADRAEQQAERERQRAEAEHRRAETERERAEKLAIALRDLGVDPESL